MTQASQRHRHDPTEERFLLKVDGQIKRSFGSKEAAATAGAVVKKAYPVVVVTGKYRVGFDQMIFDSNGLSTMSGGLRGCACR